MSPHEQPSNTGTPATPTPRNTISRRARVAATAKPFPYGELIQPECDLIKGWSNEYGRPQFCIDEDDEAELLRFAGSTTFAPWKMGYWLHKRVEPRRHGYRVVSTKFGWRVLHAPPPRSSLHTLAGSLPVPLLFPSAEVAIAAAEYDVAGKGYFQWLPPTTDYNYPCWKSARTVSK
jgi:hypothetical protein